MERKHADKVQESIRNEAFKKINKIHEVLVGDEYGNDGLIKAVNCNTKDIKEINQERKTLIKAAKWVVGIGTLMAAGWETIKHLFL